MTAGEGVGLGIGVVVTVVNVMVLRVTAPAISEAGATLVVVSVVEAKWSLQLANRRHDLPL